MALSASFALIAEREATNEGKSGMKFFQGFLASILLVLSVGRSFASQTEERFEPESGRSYRYLLYLPPGVEDSDKKLPVILYLHGASCRGDDLNKLKRYGLPQRVERHPGFPFIVISPQCSSGGSWDNPKSLIALVDDVVAHYNGDKDRVYLTGMSLGGAGVWATALAFPSRFAAIAPVCAPAPESRYGSLEDLIRVPTWIFHGTADSVIPPSGSIAAAAHLKSAGGTPILSMLEGRTHGIAEVFDREDLYAWFLEHRRSDALNSRGGHPIRRKHKG